MTFNEIKTRSKNSENNIKYFAHPFHKHNTIKLMEDLNKSKPVSLFTLTSKKEMEKGSALKSKGSTSGRNSVINSDGKEISGQMNLFGSME